MGRKRNRDTAAKMGEKRPPAPRARQAKAADARSRYELPKIARPQVNLWLIVAACAVLIVCTVLAFRPALSKDFGFVAYDDDRYIYKNEHVVQGLTMSTAAWAFTSLDYDNWHPLTWLSHMLDRQIFGPESLQHPWGYHLVNVLLHALNAALLFVALVRMTSQLWPSLAVALLFAIHPLRAESVAWISERKDVLSGLFFMLTLWAYAAYATHGRSWGRYLLVIELFILGLMAKPMLVSLPVLLLLLDYWPLERGEREREMRRVGDTRRTADATPIASFLPLLIEKLPLFALAAASCAITVFAQLGAMKVIDTTTFSMRVQNAVVTLAIYIGQVFWPVNLSPMYPFPEHGIPWYHLALAIVFLASITGAVVWMRSWRWLAVGWLWYLVTVFPVLGLVQVGVQSRADRYTYLPHIGLYIMLAWSAERLMAGWSWRPAAWATGLAVLAPVLILCTSAQTGIWKDSETLWSTAIKVNPDTAIAHNNLGSILQDKANKGLAQSRSQQLQGHNDAATALQRQSRDEMDKAFHHYQRAAEIRPRYVEAQVNLGSIYLIQEKWHDAINHLTTAIEVRPDYDLSYVRLGAALIALGKLDEAEKALRHALDINPQLPETYSRLGEVLSRQNKLDEAIKCYEVLLHDDASADDARRILGNLYHLSHRPQKALEYWTAYLNDHLNSVPVLTAMAWLLSTDPDPAMRDGPKALRLAQRANGLAQGKDAQVLMVLAAAMAENDDFMQAAQIVDAAQKAVGQPQNASAVPFSPQEMIELSRIYRSGNRYYDKGGRLPMPLPSPAGK